MATVNVKFAMVLDVFSLSLKKHIFRYKSVFILSNLRQQVFSFAGLFQRNLQIIIYFSEVGET